VAGETLTPQRKRRGEIGEPEDLRLGTGIAPADERDSVRVAMTVLACAMHWYVSGMFAVPIIAVGGWSWWNTRNAPPEDEHQGPPAHVS
jgi:hypothetical protein